MKSMATLGIISLIVIGIVFIMYHQILSEEDANMPASLKETNHILKSMAKVFIMIVLMVLLVVVAISLLFRT